MRTFVFIVAIALATSTLSLRRTGIQMVEETLAYYGNEQNAPQWLKPQFNTLEAMFGESPMEAAT